MQPTIVCLCDLSQNAPIKCCFENIKYFTKCVLRMLEMLVQGTCPRTPLTLSMSPQTKPKLYANEPNICRIFTLYIQIKTYTHITTHAYTRTHMLIKLL